jgi:hypothetical protein
MLKGERSGSDLNIVIRTGGCERTEAEYRALYKAAGFKLTKAIATPSPTGINFGCAAIGLLAVPKTKRPIPIYGTTAACFPQPRGIAMNL